MAAAPILIVEDEADIRELLAFNLEAAGHAVALAVTGEEALRAARAVPPGLVLLDLLLPGVSGLEVCAALRRDPRTSQVPIVMLTALGEEADVVRGLEAGADDYVVKPFSVGILVARVQAVLRRGTRHAATADPDAVVRVAPLVLDPGRFEALLDGAALPLTRSEFRLLHLLASRPGWVFTRQQIIDRVQGDDAAVTPRSVDVHVAALRRKLGRHGDLLETVRGVGYRFHEEERTTGKPGRTTARA